MRAIVELNAETDFVARSEDFKSFARELAEQVARQKGHSVETVLTQEFARRAGKDRSVSPRGRLYQAAREDRLQALRVHLDRRERRAGRVCSCSRQR